MSHKFPLSSLKEGEKAHIDHLLTTGHLRQRLQDLGMINGTLIQCLHKSPIGDPIAYKIRGTIIALRSEDANTIIVTS